jgi:hypothetical protein
VSTYDVSGLALLPPAECHPRHNVTGATGDTVPPHPGIMSPPPPAYDHPEGIYGRDLPKGSRERGARPKGTVRWTRVPETWEPTDSHRALAAELGVNFDLELAKFRDYEYPKTKAKSDANAAFSNWLRQAHEFASKRASGTRSPKQPNSGYRPPVE